VDLFPGESWSPFFFREDKPGTNPVFFRRDVSRPTGSCTEKASFAGGMISVPVGRRPYQADTRGNRVCPKGAVLAPAMDRCFRGLTATQPPPHPPPKLLPGGRGCQLLVARARGDGELLSWAKKGRLCKFEGEAFLAADEEEKCFQSHLDAGRVWLVIYGGGGKDKIKPHLQHV